MTTATSTTPYDAGKAAAAAGDWQNPHDPDSREGRDWLAGHLRQRDYTAQAIMGGRGREVIGSCDPFCGAPHRYGV